MYTDDIFVRVDNMYKTTNSDIAQVACKTGIVASMRGVLVRIMNTEKFENFFFIFTA